VAQGANALIHEGKEAIDALQNLGSNDRASGAVRSSQREIDCRRILPFPSTIQREQKR
jgi:hypothetical protein